MARLDEIAVGLASVLRSMPSPEPLSVDLRNETPAAATVLVRAIIDACNRSVTPLALVRICPVLGKGLLSELPSGRPIYEGIKIEADTSLDNRIELFRVQPHIEN